MFPARSFSLGALAATLVLLGTAVAASAQGTPAAVTIRVEGAGRTYVPATTVTTTTTPIDKGGTPCSGTSAGGALEQATSGRWSGAVTPDGGLTVQTILGEGHPSTDDARRWVLAVNSVPTSVGPCALELNAGDTVLLFVSAEPPRADCRTNGRDGLCGTPDRTAPAAAITSIREKQRFARRRAPLVLRGVVGADLAGLKDVRLSLTRVLGRRCAFFSGIEDTFQRAKPCGVRGGQFFSIGARSPWSFQLPARLTRGRYTLEVQAVDALDNVSAVTARGRDRIVFTVR